MKPRKRLAAVSLDVPQSKKRKLSLEKCPLCQQYEEDIKLYGGHLNKSSIETVTLTDEKLSLFTGEETDIHQDDHLPCHKLTNFSVYDEKGHLCPFDGLVEKNVLLHVSGYVKPIYDEDPSPCNGIPTHDIGPINEWYISGFDGGEKALLDVGTCCAHYILMEPSEEYSTIYKTFKQKISLVKFVIEYLQEHHSKEPTYEDLLEKIGSTVHLTEDFLLQHAQFVCEQVYSYDDDALLFIVTPCVRTLVALAGVTFKERKQMCGGPRTGQLTNGTAKKRFTKATTTPLVREIFENFFPDQIQHKDNKVPKKKRCGVCQACQAEDCGQCISCKDMVKFGGGGRSKQACQQRKCPNMAVEDLDEEHEPLPVKKKKAQCFKSVNTVEWCGQVTKTEDGISIYKCAMVGNTEIKSGDFVMLNADRLTIARIAYMYQKFPQGPTAHGHIFYTGSDTILGETANPLELFAVDICENCPLGSILKKVEVRFKETPRDWFNQGGVEPQDNNDCFYFSKRYDTKTATFTDYFETKQDSCNACSICSRKKEKKLFNTPQLLQESVMWRGVTYRVGSCVFLQPAVYNPWSSISGNDKESLNTVDESIFTEYYRKTTDIKGSNLETADPFLVGLIEQITPKAQISLKCRLFYRPEHTKSGAFLAHESDLNRLYWTDEIAFQEVVTECYVRYFDDLESSRTWCSQGPFRFYFTEMYNPFNFRYSDVPTVAKKVGGKGKKATVKTEEVRWDEVERPLRCMDVFAGCGGLSCGLHQAGVADTKWAIEMEPTAAQAFKLNNESCHMITEDCNSVLEQVITGKNSKNYPEKGDIELLVGGPPCQGFSGMNRFNAGQYSIFKNSLVVTYLSYCDYYRPKYFILENVRNFVTFKRSMVLKLTVRCLLAIGYQVRFGVLQAGQYGVPQTRRRLILLAAAPGCALPTLPEPLHCFNRRGCQLDIVLDGQRYSNGNQWGESAPYRTINVRDAISDLPEIANGWSQIEMSHDGEPVSHFQRQMRLKADDKLVDHVCKEMVAIVQARISFIPEIPGSDWRDLPNRRVELKDGSVTNVLRYPYRGKKQKKGEPNRGVCRCSIGGRCDAADRQLNTLIPWCLPHTADRHNNWAGLYGRLEWDGFFGTTITNPEPMGKQGRVLHPEQHRVVSVRECARSQGFPDHFKFCGSLMDKHRQVGNAVPPPLGKAIGMEIKKALKTRLQLFENK